jgi:pimeloyl-ACP methyl ester carboxylesterase
MSLLFRNPSAAISGMRFERRGPNAAIRELDLKNEEMALRLFVDGLRGRQDSLEKYPEDMRTMMRENVGTIRESVTKAPHFTRKEAKRITHPTLLIKGGRTIGMFSAIIDELHNILPNSQVVIIPDAAHIVHLENPGECNRAIVKFLKEHAQ